ncbi:hypothetical protein HBH98_172320 [Parastagonospora nodorum]|nr:hypothetical protein HBH43_153920 [Parastagonospora nodorum]KAH4293998.1 hypothetical protein HBI01_169960 [Parastagonospora nodorum]KAH4296686.1 hypothetical protein HBI02_168790 [Parastagonospora nodorum]KAH4325095.1 hypothetical protein HBI00_160580 [Parastagonospora nodorum]KAH4341977.1 hypothetical protein HBH98_172320 [Parastagonospora nodorum]
MHPQLADELRAILVRAQELMDDVEEATLPQDLLEAHLATLRRLQALCNPGNDNENENDVHEKELRPLQKQPRKATNAQVGGPKDPWKRITNLEHLPEVAEHVRIHIRKHGSNPRKFMRTLGLINDCGDYMSSKDLGDAFMSRYKWTIQVERRDEQVHILQLFDDLFWFDVMQLLRPGGSGRVGGTMLKELDAFLTPLLLRDDTLDKETVIQNVGDWSIRGSKINVLSKLYNPGVLLVLHKELSRSFLEGRFTASGHYFDGAIDRLNALNLKAYISSTSVGALAANIRALMIKPFETAYIEQSRKRRRIDSDDGTDEL